MPNSAPPWPPPIAPFYVVFAGSLDRPESCRFIGVDTEDGQGLGSGMAEWSDDPNHEGQARLGPLTQGSPLTLNATLLYAALKDALAEMQQALEESGGCQHDVGICACTLIRHMENARAALDAAHCDVITGSPE